MSLKPVSLLCSGLLWVVSGCGDPELVFNPKSTTSTGVGAGSGNGGGGGEGGIGITTGQGAGGMGGVECADVMCPPDQHCEVVEGVGECINNTCGDLNCSPTEECQPTPEGGAICVDISCAQDVECPPEQFCNGTICVDDVCDPNQRTCVGQTVEECESNGSGFIATFVCGTPSYFASLCLDDMMGDAYCGCEDDWDCPAFTACEVGRCEGTGQAPGCFLDPEDFANVLPTVEIQWGGTSANTMATGSAFPASAQVVMSPLVINLDDDTGDGLINELDFPEIVFATFCNSEYTNNGVLRAIHGGGINKGQDYFATCGSTVWHEGDDPNISCTCGAADLNSTASLAAGDLDNDGIPEIVALTEGNASIRIYDNTGEIISTTGPLGMVRAGTNSAYSNPGPTLANLDNAGLAEIVVGRYVFTLDHDVNGDIQVIDTFVGAFNDGDHGQGPVSCVANLVGDSKQEIIAGGTVSRLPLPPPGVTQQSDCTGLETDPEEVAYCNGQLMVVWDARTVNPTLPQAQADGFCAIADVLGVDQSIAPDPSNPLDDEAEVILIAEGRLVVFNGQDGTLRRNINLNQGARGGPPNVDDFDGDGFPEIGTAFGAGYLVIDLQDPVAECPAWPNSPLNDATSAASVNIARVPPSVVCTQDSDCSSVTPGTVCNEMTEECVCLHNGWIRRTEDDSSRVTGSSVFDFNGDGAAEVIYNDECRFRIYDGVDATVWFNEPSESRTRIEYPVVADIDNDGNAEIAFATTNESGFCSESLDAQYNNGIEVWGDAGDFWVPARRIWNQHAYHVTNVLEDGRIPEFAPESWLDYNGRRYNIFRSNPRNFGVAPDLTVVAIQVSSPDAVCGALTDNLNITAEIANIGDLRVGPGVVVGFHGEWQNPALLEPLYADGMMTPLQFTLTSSLEPGDSILITVPYNAMNNTPGTLPDNIEVIVDELMAENECQEFNNNLVEMVDAGSPLADLRIDLGTPTTPCPTVPTTVFNDGAIDASNVVVRYFAGNPNQGGTALFDHNIPGVVPAGGSTSFNVTIPNFPQGLVVTIWGVVDPQNAIAECNDGNNQDAADTTIQCGGVN